MKCVSQDMMCEENKEKNVSKYDCFLLVLCQAVILSRKTMQTLEIKYVFIYLSNCEYLGLNTLIKLQL